MRSRTIATGTGAVALALATGGQALASDAGLPLSATGGTATGMALSSATTVESGVRTPLLFAAGSLGIDAATRGSTGGEGTHAPAPRAKPARPASDPTAGSVFRIGAPGAPVRPGRSSAPRAGGETRLPDATAPRQAAGPPAARPAAAARRPHGAQDRARRAAPHRATPAHAAGEGGGGARTKALSRLRSLGHEVGDPLQLQLAAWLLALVGGACLLVARLATRGRRPS